MKQPNSMPVGCYHTKKTPLVYMTANRMAILIRESVKKACPGIVTADLKKYYAHSLQVWHAFSWMKWAKAWTIFINASA